MLNAVLRPTPTPDRRRFALTNVRAGASVATLASAMDVGNPSNLERLRAMFPELAALREAVRATSIDDAAILVEQENGGVTHESASDGEAGGAGRKVQGVAVHDGRYATDRAAGSCGKADDISGEGRA